MTLDSWNDLFNAAGVILVGLTFVVGAGALITGRQINKRQSQELLRLSADLASAQTALLTQQERAANAERTLLELQAAMRPRMLNAPLFMAELKGKPRAGFVEILYKADDEEAYTLAIQIQRWLGPGSNGDGSGWPISRVRPLTDQDAVLQNSDVPTTTKAGFFFSGGGVMIAATALPKNPFEPTVPATALFWALQKAGVRVAGISQDQSLPVAALRVIVGPKQ